MCCGKSNYSNSRYSNFSLFGLCLDAQCAKDKKIEEIKAGCAKAYPGDQEGIDGCVAAEVSQLNLATTGTATSATGSKSVFDNLLNFLHLGNPAPPPATTLPPPPPNSKLILGMDPAVAAIAIIGTAGLVIWGVVALKKGKPAVA